MRRILSIVGLVGFLAFGAFAKDNGILVKTDRFTGKTSIVMKPIRIGPLLGFRDVQHVSEKSVLFDLSFAGWAGDSGDPSLSLFVVAGGWQFLQGADVHILVDGEAIDLGHFLSVNAHVETIGTVVTIEQISGSVKRMILDRMANAKNLQLKIGLYEIRLNAKNIAHLKEFSNALSGK